MDRSHPGGPDRRFSFGSFVDPITVERALKANKAVVCATTASFFSTLAGYPLDSLKSRLQASKTPISVPRLAATVFREEGVAGFFRGLWIPLFTISIVRAASFTIYSRTKGSLHENNLLAQPTLLHVAGTGAVSGANSGALVCFGSCPFELVKIRRQLEYTIAAAKGETLLKPPTNTEAVKEIVRRSGLSGLYNGFRLHFFRDMSGTALYFMEYDGMRHILGRHPSGQQGPVPVWFPVHTSLLPFFCGAVAGVSSWALIYPLDVVKTKVQTRALAGDRYRPPFETLQRMIRGPDRNKPILVGLARLYQGLGVSALRSVATHGMLWTIFDYVERRIDALPKYPR